MDTGSQAAVPSGIADWNIGIGKESEYAESVSSMVRNEGSTEGRSSRGIGIAIGPNKDLFPWSHLEQIGVERRERDE